MTKDDLNSLHCKACDSVFNAKWYEDRGEFETLCPTCLTISIGYHYTDDADEYLELIESMGSIRLE